MSDLQMSLYYVVTNSFELPDTYKCPENFTQVFDNRPILGSYFLVSGILMICLYIPCFVVMIKSKCRTPSFQVMLILAIFDILSICVNSVITGVLDLWGTGFCHYPLFVFTSGAIGLASWMGGCIACILLAIDRCVEINSHFILGFLFWKPVFKSVMVLIVVYWLYTLGFTKPLLFRAEFSSWFFDPKIGKDPSLYHNVAHTINNLVVSLATTSLYIYLCYYLIYKFGYSTSMWLYKSKQQILMQAVILCSFHAAAAYIYVYMQFFYSPPVLIVIGQLTWQWSNGCFCIVYLTLNRTIRNSVIRLLFSLKFREKFGLHIGIDEQLNMNSTQPGKTLVNIVAPHVMVGNFF